MQSQELLPIVLQLHPCRIFQKLARPHKGDRGGHAGFAVKVMRIWGLTKGEKLAP